MPALPGIEERLHITRGIVLTQFATVTGHWPYVINDISPLWDTEDVTIVNRQVGGSTEAEVSYPLVPAPSRRPVQVLVCGDWDLNGDPVDTGLVVQRTQLRANIANLITNVVGRVTSYPGTADAEMFGPGGVTCGVKPVQFVGPMRTLKDTPISALATLDLYFPKGVFTL